jgi:predicted nucleic acid-binding Zn ribbon protein
MEICHHWVIFLWFQDRQVVSHGCADILQRNQQRQIQFGNFSYLNNILHSHYAEHL